MMTGYKTVIGMVIVLVGQVCHLLGGRWPVLAALANPLIDVGAGIGAIGIGHRIARSKSEE